MRADRGVLLIGLLLVAAAVAGGSVSGAGVTIPVLDNPTQQVIIAALGVAAIASSIFLRFNTSGPDGDQDAVLGPAPPSNTSPSLLDLIGPVERHQRVEVTITIGDVFEVSPSEQPEVIVNEVANQATEGPFGGSSEDRLHDRKEELEALRSAVLLCSQARVSVVAVTGRAGSGKTALVKAYVRRFGDFFDSVVWIAGEADLSLLAEMSVGVLVIVDDPVSTGDDLIHHINSCQAVVIFVGRILKFDREDAIVLDVADFSVEVATQFILQESGDDDEASATEIASALEGSPALLTLVLQIVRTEGLTLRQYSQKYLKPGDGNGV